MNDELQISQDEKLKRIYREVQQKFSFKINQEHDLLHMEENWRTRSVVTGSLQTCEHPAKLLRPSSILLYTFT